MFGSSPYLPLALVFALQIKHFIADGPLQTRAMVEAKRIYGTPAGLLHAGVHMAATAVVLWAFSLPWWLLVALAAAEGVIHYHIDFGKSRLVAARGWTVSEPQFWWAYIADQGLHQATYLAIAAIAVALA